MSTILKVKRLIKNNNYTLGKLYYNDRFLCSTLEDKDRGLYDTMTLEEINNKKVYGETAIPYGTYDIDMNTISPKFKDRTWAKPYNGIIPRLVNVKGFEGVLIHVGNYAKDTLGCILVGTVSGDCLINSRKAYDALMYNLLLDKNKGSIKLIIE